MSGGGARRRRRVAFFDSFELYDDAYRQVDVTEDALATTFTASSVHAFLAVLQDFVGDTTWFVGTPRAGSVSRHRDGYAIHFVRTSWLHRLVRRTGRAGARRAPSVRDPRVVARTPGTYRIERTYRIVTSALSVASPRLWLRVLRSRPDVIVVSEYDDPRFDGIFLMAKALRRPLVTIHAGSALDMHRGVWLRHMTLRRADVVVADSTREERLLLDHWRVDAKRVTRILTPIDAEIYRPSDRAAASASLGLADRRRIAFVGRLDPVKRVVETIEAFDAADIDDDVELVIAGTGPILSDVERAASRSRRPVRLLGWIAEEPRRAALYNASDLLVLASWSEGFPTVVGEALACGVPVIASDVGGVRDVVIPGRSGWLVSPGDDAGLRNAITEALGTDLAALRAGARAVALEHLTRDRLGCMLGDVIASAIDARRGHGR